MDTRGIVNVCKTMKRYLEDIHSEQFCSKLCKANYMHTMFSYMLSNQAKYILLRPQFANFRLTVMKKCDEIRLDAEDCKSRLGAWGLGIETYDEYNKLIDILLEMMMFLEDHGVTTPYASSKSPTKPVRPVSIPVNVLPRRSARLMAKNK